MLTLPREDYLKEVKPSPISIYGYYPDYKELVKIATEIDESLPKQIMSDDGGELVPFELDVYVNHRESFLSVGMAHTRVRKEISASPIPYSKQIAMISPFHKLVVMGWQSGEFTAQFPEYREYFSRLGYTVYENSDELCNVSFLEGLRKSRLTKKLDTRAEAILKALNDGLNLDNPEYEFAFYNIEVKRRRQRDVSGDLTRDKLLERTKKTFFMPTREVFSGGLESFCAELNIDDTLAITSRVRAGGEIVHIPQIDFGRWFNPFLNEVWTGGTYLHRPIDSITRYLTEFGMNGLIVGSGGSAHFYGFEPLNEKEWKRFMKKVSKENSFVFDTNWARVQSKVGFSSLRLLPCQAKMYQPAVHSIYKTEKK